MPIFIYQFVGFLRKSNKIKISLNPQFQDFYDSSGVAKGHYFHQDIIVARWVLENKPEKHLDVASRIDGFVSKIAVFMKVDVADIRPLTTTEKNISFKQIDLMSDSEMQMYPSVSCLHSIEHFGLGRYGDKIDVDGHLTGFKNLVKVLEPGGTLYFSVPMGPLRIEFNAHRVFSIEYILNQFIVTNNLTVNRFSYINDDGEAVENADYRDGLISNFHCNYGCAIFELKKGD